MENLNYTYPHQEEGKIKKIFIAVIVVFLLAALGAGVYLVGQRTNFFPKAGNQAAKNLENSLSLVSSRVAANLNEEIPVEVIVRTDLDESNLFVAKINFPKDLLEVQSIATPSASPIKKWIETSFDNQTGQISLAGGVFNPGIRTEDNRSFVLGTVIFKAKKWGEAELDFTEESAIFRNIGNNSVLQTQRGFQVRVNNQPGLSASVSASLAPAAPKCQPRPACLDARPACKSPEPAGGWCLKPKSSLKLLSPNGGEVFNYYAGVPINWRAEGASRLALSIYLNGNFFGKVAGIPSGSNFVWMPAQTLPLIYLSDQNTFQLGISGVTNQGENLLDLSDGPISFTTYPLEAQASASASLRDINGDINEDGKRDFADLSALLSNFGRKPILNKNADLNGDRVVNELDFWLIQNASY